ncbi:MAG: [acyl-carrier-protein] S-malonyltransferase [Clostridiales bacterium]|nr:[acyl-carrier-protein] S-malonyltransferase [Clostridiales bacterium]
MKRAFLFPGQGAQSVGMGKDFYEKYEEARKIYDKASEISGMDIKKICFEGPEEELMKTENTQIAILTTSLAILEVLRLHNIEAQIATGLSLGEYTALIYSGVISFEDGIKLIKKRGYYMQHLLPNKKFEMAAVIGLNSSKIEEVCKQIEKTGKFITPANYNCKIQTVISGEESAINEATIKLKELGAKRVIPLKTSGPFHTKKLEKAKEEYSKELDKITFNKGKVKVIKNIDGNYYLENENLKQILAEHIVNPVRFDKTIELMENENIDEYIEIGPGKALTGFIKKDIKEAKTYNINNIETLENYLKEEI